MPRQDDRPPSGASRSAPPPPAGAAAWILAVYFGSGACSLIDEVVWARLLKLTLGNTVYANTVVVSVFMGGLALGALVMSRFADRLSQRLRLYAILEGLVTVSALALPWALRRVDHVYVWFYRTWDPSNAQLLGVQIVVSALLLLVPTLLMGSTLPLLGRFVTSLEREAGHLVGRLYALNTLGAALGCFAAGFVLIRSVGVMGTLYVAAGLNLVVALGGAVLSRIPEGAGAAAGTAPPPPSASRPAPTPDRRFPLLVGAFFVSGLTSIGYELLWMRSVVHLLGGVTYVFSAVLTVYLLGNVLGAAIGSRLVRRLREPAVGLAVTLFALGLCGLLYLPGLLWWTSRVVPGLDRVMIPVYAALSISPLVARPFLQSLLIFLIPSTIMGIGFPVALQAWANHVHQVGRSTGTAYGANTIGAVVGGILTGFVLLPTFGLQVSLSVLALATVWAAAVLAARFVDAGRGRRRFALAGLAVVLTGAAALGPTDLFGRVISHGMFISDMDLVAVEEGLTTTVSLHRDRSDQSLHLYSSGQSLAGDSYVERGDQKMLGHFSVLLDKNAHRVLSVGFGSGETTSCLSMHSLDDIDCVEIAREIVKVSLRYFRHINLGDRLDDEIDMIYMDAKNYLHLTDEKYDIIVNDSIHPRDFADNASLHTREYFEDAKARMTEHGLLTTWVPSYRMSIGIFRSIIGTLMDVFPHVTLWYLTPHPAPLVLVIASLEPVTVSPLHVEQELSDGRTRENLAAMNVHDAMDVVSCYIADEDDLRPVVDGFSLNSDYHPFIEFSTEELTPPQDILRMFVYGMSRESVYDHLDFTGFDPEAREEWLASYRKLHEASGDLLAAYDSRDGLEKYENTLKGLRILPHNPGLLAFRDGLEDLLYEQGVSLVRGGRVDDALTFGGQLLRMNAESPGGWMIRSAALQARGDADGALEAARRSVAVAPGSAPAHARLGFILLTTGREKEAIESLRASLAIDGDQPSALNALARALMNRRGAEYYDPLEAAELARRASDLTGRRNVTVLDTWMQASALAGRGDDARTAAEGILGLDPSPDVRSRAEGLLQRLSARGERPGGAAG